MGYTDIEKRRAAQRALYHRTDKEKLRKKARARYARKRQSKTWCEHQRQLRRLRRPSTKQKKQMAERAKRYRNDPKLRMQHEARWQAREAFKRGKIKRMPCIKCGARKSQMHHPDYYKPLEIIWLCAPCHGQESRKEL